VIDSAGSSAHEIALPLEKDHATTEDLRTAMILYRSLFEELVQVGSHSCRRIVLLRILWQPATCGNISSRSLQ
jgi:hypothetical protein